MRASLTKKFSFDSAHFLSGHLGKCARLHGHNWNVFVTVSRRTGLVIDEPGSPSDGMIMDFKELEKIVNPIIDDLDHRLLNDILHYRPTAENIAKYIFDRINKVLSTELSLLVVKVYESEGSYVEVIK